jgi:hypothetical protein
VVDGRGVQAGCEGGHQRGADGEREQGDQHAGGLRPEELVTVARPSGQEGRTEDEKKRPEYRADQGGLDHGRETGSEREDSHQQLGKIADARLQQTCRARAQALADLFDGLAHKGCEEPQGAS